MIFLFLAAVMLIIYGSLYPWEYQPRILLDNPIRMVWESRPAVNRWVVRDILLNVALYVPLGVTAFLSLSQARPRWLRAAFGIASAIALSLSVEVAQLHFGGRVSNLYDLAANTAGGVLGVWIAANLRTLRPHWSVGVRADVWLMLAVFLTWQLFPFIPTVHWTGVVERTRTLIQSEVSAPRVAATFTAWLLLACTMRAAGGRWRVLGILVAAVAIPVARLGLAGRNTTWSDFLGVAAAILLWRLWLDKARNPWAIAAAAAIVTILLRELTPFTPGPSQSFMWTPFMASLSGEWIHASIVLAEKTGLYAAAVWLTWRAGMPIMAAAGSVALLLLGCELAQTRLAGRMPEITDPLIALLAGWAMRILAGFRHRARGGA